MPLPSLNLAAPPPGTRGNQTASGNYRVPGYTPSGRAFDPSQYGTAGPEPGAGLAPIVRAGNLQSPSQMGYNGGMGVWNNPAHAALLTNAISKNNSLIPTLINRYGAPGYGSQVNFPSQYSWLNNPGGYAFNPATGGVNFAATGTTMTSGASNRGVAGAVGSGPYSGLYSPWGGYP